LPWDRRLQQMGRADGGVSGRKMRAVLGGPAIPTARTSEGLQVVQHPRATGRFLVVRRMGTDPREGGQSQPGERLEAAASIDEVVRHGKFSEGRARAGEFSKGYVRAFGLPACRCAAILLGSVIGKCGGTLFK